MASPVADARLCGFFFVSTNTMCSGCFYNNIAFARLLPTRQRIEHLVGTALDGHIETVHPKCLSDHSFDCAARCCSKRGYPALRSARVTASKNPRAAKDGDTSRRFFLMDFHKWLKSEIGFVRVLRLNVVPVGIAETMNKMRPHHRPGGRVEVHYLLSCRPYYAHIAAAASFKSDFG